jgi:hypothetical protein
MPFGKYSERLCGNGECGKRFKPTTPWQECCDASCRAHRTYLRHTLPKRRREQRLRTAGK